MNWNSGSAVADQVYENFLRQGRISAVFAPNDWMALGFMNRLAEFGVRVPEDLSVIDCDDIPPAAQKTPGLTTFRMTLR